MDLLIALPRVARAAWKPIFAIAALLGGAGLWLFAIGSLRGGDAFHPDDLASQPFVFATFDSNADTVWIAAGADPTQRVKALTVPHAVDYGAFFALSPDGKRIAYTVLPAGTAAPTPDTPAEVWVATLDGEVAPRRVAEDADLLVPPVWSPAGDALVFRRSQPAADRAGDFSLVSTDLRSGAETIVAATTDVALFPVAFSADGRSLSFVSLSPAGSDYNLVDVTTGSRTTTRLSTELTRDWTLSPDGGELAFLVLAAGADRYSARVATANLETGDVTMAPPGLWDELGPAWTTDDGGLTYGRLVPGEGGTAVVDTGGQTRTLAGPARGFDVPLAWSADGALLAVQSFDGTSILNPGRQALALVDKHGGRRPVAAGEVTFVGWLN